MNPWEDETFIAYDGIGVVDRTFVRQVLMMKALYLQLLALGSDGHDDGFFES